MTWRKDRAFEVILAIGGWKGWMLVVMIRTMLFPRFLVRDSYHPVLNEQVKFTPHLSVGDFFHKITEWKVVSAEIPLHFILCLDSQFSPRNNTDLFHWPLSAACWEFPSLLERVQGESRTGASLPDFLLGNLFLSWSPVKREQKQNKKANIANSAHFFISKGLKILWNYWAENHSYNKVEMIPSGKTGQLYHYCCRAESSERPLHHQLSNYKDSHCTPCNNYP